MCAKSQSGGGVADSLCEAAGGRVVGISKAAYSCLDQSCFCGAISNIKVFVCSVVNIF